LLLRLDDLEAAPRRDELHHPVEPFAVLGRHEELAQLPKGGEPTATSRKLLRRSFHGRSQDAGELGSLSRHKLPSRGPELGTGLGQTNELSVDGERQSQSAFLQMGVDVGLAADEALGLAFEDDFVVHGRDSVVGGCSEDNTPPSPLGPTNATGPTNVVGPTAPGVLSFDEHTKGVKDMKKYHVRFDQATVERLKDVARRKAVLWGRDVNWAALIRDAANQILAAEGQNHQSPTIEKAIMSGGGR
jgi:hypothetical protein